MRMDALSDLKRAALLFSDFAVFNTANRRRNDEQN